MKTREIVIYGILSAVLLAAQVSLGFLPNIEIVTLLILVYTLVFRKKVFFIIYIFVFLEKESDECLYAPDIQVVYPPESKSIDQTFQKNKDVNDKEYFLSKHKCIHKDQIIFHT